MAEQVSGALRKGGRVGRLTWRDPEGLEVEANDVTLAWQPLSLLSGRLVFDSFSARTIRVDDRRAKSTPSGPPTSLRLPLALELQAFSIGSISWAGPPAFEASDLRGRYSYTGLEHQLQLVNARVAGGTYRGEVNIGSGGQLLLRASLSGLVQADIPGSSSTLPLAFDATVQGPLVSLQVDAGLRLDKSAISGLRPEAHATAHLALWAAQPLPHAEASFRDLDTAMLWSGAPRTQLTGTASVLPAGTDAWLVKMQLVNAQAGPWDQKQLPLGQLDATGEWRGGRALLRSLDARAAQGRIRATGDWVASAAANAGAIVNHDWQLDATFEQINPAQVHGMLAAQNVDGHANVRSVGERIAFDTMLKARNGPAGQVNVLQALALRDAAASGTWLAGQGGGTLDLAALRVRTNNAELKVSGQFQPKAKAGKGELTLAAPGLQAFARGELRPTIGRGLLELQAADAKQVLGWLRTLPGAGTFLPTANAQGSGSLRLGWQGGWNDPAIDARLELPLLDLTDQTATAAEPLKLRAVQANMSGRVSQAQLRLDGRLESGARRFMLKLAAEAGGTGLVQGMAPWEAASWRGLITQLRLEAQDPALGSLPWRAESQRDFDLRWTRGTLDASAGQVMLIAPTPAGSAVPSQAVIEWQPVHWRNGELMTAGKIKGLPLAWIELIAGPQMAGAGLAGNLVADGEWDALLSDKFRLKAQLSRSSGDLIVLAETGQGTATRVSAGIREARLSLNSEGDNVTAAFRWDSERAGNADGQLRTRLQRLANGGWNWPVDAPLSGQLRAQLPRIGAWSVLAPPGWRLRGSLGTSLLIAGTRSAPLVTGDLRADDLALRSVVDGIEFGNGTLRAQLDGTRMHISDFTLQGPGGRSKGGLLTAQGEAGWINGQAQAKLDARLDGLRASLRTDRQLTVSGNLQADLAGRQASLAGTLRIDQARILLPDEGRPQLGSDVLIRSAATGTVFGSHTVQAPALSPGAARAMKIDVKLDLGSDFRVEGKGIETRVRGVLALNGESLASPRLVGTVSTFGGQYRAYGQRLDVEQGVLRFTGPIDNPSLDILAVRPNMTQRVGVQITGTALLPSVRLYAQPELPDAEKLSWLVLGRASASGGAEAALVQQAAVALLGSKTGNRSGGLAASFGLDELSFSGGESGASGAAVTLGKRFSRNFYAAYERSLSGALGTLSVFYELSQRFTVRGQTGQQTAIDLIFTLPYD